MKRRLFALLLAVSLMAVAITGCKDKENDKADKNVESVDDGAEKEDPGNDADKDDSGDGYVEMTEGPIDDGMIEVVGEVTPIGGEDADEVTPIGGEDEDDDADVVVTDWSQAYDDYFTRDGIISEKFMLSMSMEEHGMICDVSLGSAGERVFLSCDFGIAALELYSIDDIVYACTKYDGTEEWIYAPMTENEDPHSMFNIMDTDFSQVGEDVICTYREEVVIDGVVYDVLDVEKTSDSVESGAYYINRETQKIAKLVFVAEGTEVECFFNEIESIELPAEAANATEGTAEDIEGALIGVIFMSMSAGM